MGRKNIKKKISRKEKEMDRRQPTNSGIVIRGNGTLPPTNGQVKFQNRINS